jgi:ankyrin repeat protein
MSKNQSYREIEELLMYFSPPPSHNTKQKKYVENPFITAMLEDDYDSFEQAINEKENIDKPSKIGYSPLHVAVNDGMSGYAKLLIDNNADVNVQIPDSGFSPLHIAARTEQKELVNYLLKSGAAVDLADCAGRSALDVAKETGNTEIISLFEPKDSQLIDYWHILDACHII